MNSNNNLDKYFTQAQKAGNPQGFFSDDELRSITEKGYAGGKLNPITKILKILKRNKIMSISLLTLISALLWFSLTGNEEKTNYENEDTQTGEGAIASTVNSSEQAIKGIDEENVQHEKADKSKNIIQIPIIKLSEEELNKIGIYERDGGYTFISYSIESFDGSIKPKLNIIDTFGLRKVEDEFFTVPYIVDLIPAGIISNYINYEGNRAILSQAFKNVPYMLGDAIEELKLELVDILDTVAYYRNKGIRDKDNIKINTENFPLFKSLLPVYLHAGDKNTGSDVLIWYLPNKAFIDKLPERYKKPLLENNRTKELVEFSFKEFFEKKKEKTIFRAKFDDSQKSYWKELIYNTRTKQVEGIPYTSDDKVKNIGSVQLTVGELKKIMNNLHFELKHLKPPSIDILRYENNIDKFNANLYHAIGRVKKSDDIENYIAKIQLYEYIAKLIAYDIQGIEEIEINKDELEGLNIYVKDTCYITYRDNKYDLTKIGLQYVGKYSKMDSSITHTRINIKHRTNAKPLAELGYDTTIKIGYYRLIMHLYPQTDIQETIPFENWDQQEFLKVQPVAITFKRTQYEYSEKYGIFNHSISTSVNVFEKSPLINEPYSLIERYSWSKNNFSSNLQKFIPIHFTLGDTTTRDSSKLAYTDYSLWYILNEDFINALPERYHESLRKELELITGIEEGTIAAEAACEAIKGKESYLDLCRYESATIKDLQFYPNPTSSKEVKLKFLLTKRCKIRIDVHELSGRFIGNLGNIPFAPGEQNLILEFRRYISQGVYLISITTDTGEQVVRRLIVE